MTEVHLPQLEDEDDETRGHAPETAAPAAVHEPAPARRGRPQSFLRLALELALIATGVFLGLAGEQWRENARHRELAHDSLRRLRTEIVTNRKSVEAVKDYHVAMQARIQAYFAADAKKRRNVEVALRGVQPANFEHTAWDLALATQALTYIHPDLAFALSRAYGVQQEYSELSRALLQAMYLHTPGQDLDAFLQAIDVYYGDVVLIEPNLLHMYDELLPQIDRALGEPRRSE